MPIQDMPKFKSVPDKMLELPQPGIGGLNLRDLEFEQEVNQTPYMLNMMYRNGALAKRYGQEVYNNYAFDASVVATYYYKDKIIVHTGTKVYQSNGTTFTQIASGLTTNKGLFITYAQTLYYLQNKIFYKYDGTTWSTMNPFVPDVLINCKPDGTHSDTVDDYNIIGLQFSHTYNGEAGVTAYSIYDDFDVINQSVTPTVLVNDTATTAFSINWTSKKINFTNAPGEGSLNVKVTWTLKTSGNASVNALTSERNSLLSCKYYSTFGGANNSRLFLAGSGHSKYYYSNAYDISYFPERNFAILGNSEEDITGFGRQYNVLIIFKPREVYSIYSYTETSSTTVVVEDIGLEAFKSQLVNASVGCDCPNSIQVINNLLTWFNSKVGICTLVSTNVVDERNVRQISRNIERTNRFGIKGVLDFNENLNNIQSVDFDNKYFLVFPASGMCFMWDYSISPYSYSSNGETPPKTLDWYLFDKFYVKEFIQVGSDLLYASSYNKSGVNFTTKLIKLNDSFVDLDFNNDTNADPIKAYYMTPFLQFGSVEYLKNIKNIYVQCRGDTQTIIDMYYYTDESSQPEQETESIRLGGTLWNKFHWYNFQWIVVAWANTFRRKCNLKKVQMASFYFENNEANRDMSITHIGLQYQYVKYVR